MTHQIDMSRLSAIAQTRDTLQAAARKANDAVDEFHRERCSVIHEIDCLKGSWPGTMNAADEKNKMLDRLAARRDLLTAKIKEARSIQEDADERALAAVRLFEECDKYARSA